MDNQDNNEISVEQKAQFDSIQEKQIRENFSSFAKLVEQIAELETISPEFIEEMEFAMFSLGLIVTSHGDSFDQYRDQGGK